MKARAVRIVEPGGPEALEFAEVSVRAPGFGEIAVDVAASALNRADLLQRRGFYAAPPGSPADIPGLEYAGVVAQVGEGVTLFQPGDRVMGIVGGGGQATRIVVHEREAIPIPHGVDTVDAAAIPEVFLTAWDALLQANARPGEVVLIHAVASGVGTAAVQLCHLLGAIPVGTTRTFDKLDRCKEVGLDHGIVVADGSFADAVRSIAPDGADVIIDSVGASYLTENLDALAPRGRMVLIGLMGGASGEIPLGQVLSKRAQIIGTTLRARPLEEKATLARRFAREIVPHFVSGRLKPVVGSRRPMLEIRDAHAEMERNETFGKTVLAW